MPRATNQPQVAAGPPIRCHTGRRHRITHLDVLRSGCDQRASHCPVRWTLTDIRQIPTILGQDRPFYPARAMANCLRHGQGAIEASKPAVDGGAFLIRTVLPASRQASPLVAPAFDLPGTSCRRSCARNSAAPSASSSARRTRSPNGSGTDGLRTLRWRGLDSNLWFRNSHHAAQDRLSEADQCTTERGFGRVPAYPALSSRPPVVTLEKWTPVCGFLPSAIQ